MSKKPSDLWNSPVMAELAKLAGTWQPSGPEWKELVKAYRKIGQARPNLATVAEEMGWHSEQPLRDLIHRVGIERWHDVHAWVAAEPD
jgi:hypothetical protein